MHRRTRGSGKTRRIDGRVENIIVWATVFETIVLTFIIFFCDIQIKGFSGSKQVLTSKKSRGGFFAKKFHCIASWYSCAETSGVCANGSKLDDNALTCASWDFPFGTNLCVTNNKNKKSIVVKVTDRGPSMKLYEKGRKIDLTKGAFEKIADLKNGIIAVSVEELFN